MLSCPSMPLVIHILLNCGERKQHAKTGKYSIGKCIKAENMLKSSNESTGSVCRKEFMRGIWDVCT